MASWAYIFAGQTRGRPRERYSVHEIPAIDVNALRRQAKADGHDLSDPPAFGVEWIGRDGERPRRSLAIRVTEHPIYRWRWWFWCPRCYRNVGRLHVTRVGPACHRCHRLTYRDRRFDSDGPDRIDLNS